MDRRLVRRAFLVSATRTLDEVRWDRNLLAIVDARDRCGLVVGSVLEVEKEVGTETVHPLLGNYLTGLVLMLKNDNGSVDRTGVELGARRDGVVPGLETGNSRNDDIEGDLPWGSARWRGGSLDVVSSSKLENLAQLEATLSNDGVVLVLVLVKIPHISLSLGGRGELGE
jgi:hypothetical protein